MKQYGSFRSLAHFCQTFCGRRGLLPAGIAISLVFAGCGQSSERPTGKTVPETANKAADGSGETGHLLPEAERSYLWDIEHLGFIVEQTVFSQLKSSINNGSLSAWDTFLSDDCNARLHPGSPDVRPFLSGEAEFVRITADAETQPVGKAEFIAWLRDVRKEMDQCGTSIGLVRLGPAADRSFAGAWRSVWRIRIAGQALGKPTEIVFDLDVEMAELDEKISEKSGWIRQVAVKDFRRFTADRPLMEDATAASGLVSERRYDNWNESTFVPNTGGVYVADYDNDGHLDVFVDDYRDHDRLYRGHGDGTFEDVTAAAGMPVKEEIRSWTLSCWGDFDGDADLDLITQDRLLENLGDGHFRDISDQVGLPLTPAAGYAVCDYDLDGKLDLYVCHTSAYRVGQEQKSRVSWIDDGLGVDNILYRNLGDWKFQDVTKETGTGGNGSSCFTAVWLHVNDDDRPDLFAINEFGRNSMLINNPDGAFTDGDVDPVFGGFSMGVAAGDYDNDGRTDLYVANMYSKAGNRILANVDVSDYPIEIFQKIEEGTRGSKLYRSLGNSKGTDAWQTIAADRMYADVGWSYGPAFVDLDCDGWLDMYGTAGFKSVKRGEPDG